MRAGPDHLFHLHVVSNDPVLNERLEAVSRGYDELRMTLSGAMHGGRRNTDMLVVPASLLFDLKNTPPDAERHPDSFPVPFICYGSAALLEPSFLAGCRDYLRDPWEPEELFLRVRRFTACRRLRIGDLEADLSEGVLRSPRGTALLSGYERAVMAILARNAGVSVPREAFSLALWRSSRTGSRVLDMHICAIRKKLDRVAGPGSGAYLIETCRGKGYRLRTESDSVPTSGG